MEEYSDIQIARRVTRLIDNADKPMEFPLLGCMYFILMVALVITGVMSLF